MYRVIFFLPVFLTLYANAQQVPLHHYNDDSNSKFIRRAFKIASTRDYNLLIWISLTIFAFIAYRYDSLQRVRMSNIRSKITQDLHDQVGATLSGTAMYSYIAKDQIKNEEHQSVTDSLETIEDNAGKRVVKLNNIFLAVNSVQDNLHVLLERLKEFAMHIATVKDIRLNFIVPTEVQELKLSMEHRKNIYLICNEAINSSVRCSGANLLRVKIVFARKHISIGIEDNFSGFSPTVISKENGSLNVATRAKEIRAKLEIDGETRAVIRITLDCGLFNS